MFATWIDASGHSIGRSTYFGGSDFDEAKDLAIDSLGQAVVGGYDFGTTIAVDDQSNVYVAGLTDSNNFPLVSPIQSPGLQLSSFVSVVDHAGSQLLFSTYLGGDDGDFGFDLAVRGDQAYLTGSTSSSNFPVQQPWQGVSHGITDGFISIIDTGVGDCREIFSLAAVPAHQTINFDTQGSPAVLGSLYQTSHGVVFENSSVTKAKALGSEPAKAKSAPNFATNDAVFPKTSSNVPMVINFATPKTHVGMWVGNGEQSVSTAVLTALDANGLVLCQSVRSGVPEPHSLFVGLNDPAGRIREVQLDYGATVFSESIDDLVFSP